MDSSDHNPEVPADPDFPRLREAIRTFAVQKVKDPDLAEDLTQETLLRVQSRLHTLRSAERFQSWAFQIARNVIADHFRKERETETFDEESHGGSVIEVPADSSSDTAGLSESLAGYIRSVERHAGAR